MQVINNFSEFEPALQGYFARHTSEMSPNYLVVGIIGAQSSGKSTLLNKVFQTTFQVMDSKAQRKQTTKGIWCSVIAPNDMIVLDIEGSDSRERWEQKSSMEKKTALFGLVMSHVLIVNIWCNEIGRFSAANYDILKVVLELNLRDFSRDAPKKIVFVVRDFEERENFDHIQKLLIEDLQRLWGEVTKPEEMKSLPLNSLVDIRVYKIAHMKFAPKEFEDNISEFREKLLGKNKPDYIFKGYETKNVPFDGLYPYMKTVWEAIASNKDINIPDQKVVVSAFRCDQIKKDTLSASMRSISDMKSRLRDGKAVNLREELASLRQSAMAQFKSATNHYDPKVVSNASQEFDKSLLDEFTSVLRILDERKTELYLGEMETRLRGLLRTTNSLPQFIEAASKAKSEAISNHKAFLDHCELSEEENTSFAGAFALRVTTVFQKFLSTHADSILDKWERKFAREFDEKIFDSLKDLSVETWEDFNKNVSQAMAEIRRGCEQIRDHEDAKAVFSPELLEQFQTDFLDSLKKLTRSKKYLLTSALLESFKSKFEKTESGITKNWRALSDGEIEQTHQEAFKRFERSLKPLETDLVLAWDSTVLLSAEELLPIKVELERQILAQKEAAFNVKYNRNSIQTVPGWLWAILLFFMHDNVLEWLRSPTLVIFFLLIAGVGLYLVWNGQYQNVLAIAKVTVQPVLDAGFAFLKNTLAKAQSNNARPSAQAQQ